MLLLARSLLGVGFAPTRLLTRPLRTVWSVVSKPPARHREDALGGDDVKALFPNDLVFFQNGAWSDDGASFVLDGQGHVTAIHLSTGTVSEIRVPPPKVRVSGTDVVKRRFLRFVWLSMFFHDSVHTGTANTAVRRSDQGIVAVEEASKPFLLTFQDERIVRGRWLFHVDPSSVHDGDGVEYHYRPFVGDSPLRVNGDNVPWGGVDGFPAMIHSLGRMDDILVFPVISTRFGGWRDFFMGRKRMPFHEVTPFQWLFYNTTSKESRVVDTPTTSNALHVVSTVRSGEHVSIYACHVTNLSSFLECTSGDVSMPTFEFRKDTIHLGTMELLDSVVFEDAAGDFPNHVDDTTVLINTLDDQEGFSTVVLFDLSKDRVLRRVRLPHVARDVIHHDGFLMYCTLDRFVVFDMASHMSVMEVPIPRRRSNFHASLLSVM